MAKQRPDRRKPVSARGIAAVLAILAAGPAGGAAAAQPAGWQAKLTETVPVLMEKASVPGSIVGVWRDDGQSYIEAFGVSDTATGAPMTTDLYTRIGSVTKSFTTTAILQLADQGKVGLDDPISKYVSGVPGGDKITLRLLAAMRSGLFGYTDVISPMLPSDPEREWTIEELLKIAFSHPPIFPPGTDFDYCNTNTVLLGLAVEKASGQSLADFFDEHIIRPAKLDHTSLPASTVFPAPHTHGYLKDPDGKVVDATDWNPSWAWAAGGMVSTVDDLHVWARDVATGTFLAPATQREREQFFLPAPSEGTGSLYGLGLENQNGWIGHNGNISGYQTYAYYHPAERTTLVVIVNSNVDLIGVWDLVTEVVKTITPDHPWPAPPSAP